jgi:hypothetical protein
MCLSGCLLYLHLIITNTSAASTTSLQLLSQFPVWLHCLATLALDHTQDLVVDLLLLDFHDLFEVLFVVRVHVGSCLCICEGLLLGLAQIATVLFLEGKAEYLLKVFFVEGDWGFLQVLLLVTFDVEKCIDLCKEYGNRCHFVNCSRLRGLVELKYLLKKVLPELLHPLYDSLARL